MAWDRNICMAWLGWQKHTLSIGFLSSVFVWPGWDDLRFSILILDFFSRTKLWWPLCVSEPVQMSMFSFFLPEVFLIYCYKVMALCASGLFRVAMMIKVFVSRCWDLNYSRTIFWWALCVSEPASSPLLENYEPLLMPMVYLNSLGLKCWYWLFVYCYIWRLCRLEQVPLVRIMKLTVLRC